LFLLLSYFCHTFQKITDLVYNTGDMTEKNKVKKPSFIYGTAWKEDATSGLVIKAVSMGFTAIDTANQPRHYQEPLVGDALLALEKEGIPRDSLFLQTKFTPLDGHDHRIPYDPGSDLATQVAQSFAGSLKNLRTDYVDSYLLHGPYSMVGLSNSDWQVWHAIEEIYQSGQARLIGVSNVNIGQLETLTEKARIKPMVVQNRCYAHQGWDRTVREFCQANKIIYQGFSLLTANWFVLQHPMVKRIAQRLEKTPAQVVFRYALQIGMVPLTGTSNEQHMKEDLQAHDFELTTADLNVIDSIGNR
jgi:diketogulonate reductase-like aldo/keto reductase